MQLPFLNVSSESSSDQEVSDQMRDQLIIKKSNPEQMLQIGKMLAVLVGIGFAFVIYVGIRGSWKKHVTPLYSRASNPRRKKRKARRSIR